MISTEHKQTIVLHNSELLEVIALTLDTTSICGNVMYLFKYRGNIPRNTHTHTHVSSVELNIVFNSNLFTDQNIICTGDYTSSGKLYVNPNICPLIAQESQIHYLYADNTLAFSDNHYGITAKAASKYIVKHMSYALNLQFTRFDLIFLTILFVIFVENILIVQFIYIVVRMDLNQFW